MINLAFWQREQEILRAILLPRLTQMAFMAMREAAIKAAITFDPTLANQDAVEWAALYTDELLIQLGSTSERQTGAIIADWIKRPNATIGELNAALADAFGDRASLVAVTETTRAFAAGEEIAYLRAGITEWTWQTNRDEMVCKYCRKAHGNTVKIGQPFGDFRGKDVTRPPYHPDCRCWVAPKVR